MAYYEYQLSADQKGYYIWFEYDREMVDAIKQVPGTARKWDAEEKVWFIDAGWFKDACRFLDWTVNRDRGSSGHQGRDRSAKQAPPGGQKTSENRYRYSSSHSWGDATREPAAAGSSPKKKTCFEQLHLMTDVPLPVLTAVYRALIKLHHPDVGGDPKRMVEVNLAYEAALKIKEREAQSK